MSTRPLVVNKIYSERHGTNRVSFNLLVSYKITKVECAHSKKNLPTSTQVASTIVKTHKLWIFLKARRKLVQSFVNNVGDLD